jgi:hypothetical protein
MESYIRKRPKQMRLHYHAYFPAMHFQEMQLRMNMRAVLAAGPPPGWARWPRARPRAMRPAGPDSGGAAVGQRWGSGHNVLTCTTPNRATGHMGHCGEFGSYSALALSPQPCLWPRSSGSGAGRGVSMEIARVERCTVAGVGVTVCRARDQCDSAESPDPLNSGRPGPVARGVSSEPIAARCLSGRRSTTSRSRPRSRRSAAPMTPLHSNQPSSPTAAGPVRCRHGRAAA